MKGDPYALKAGSRKTGGAGRQYCNEQRAGTAWNARVGVELHEISWDVRSKRSKCLEQLTGTNLEQRERRGAPLDQQRDQAQLPAA